MLIIDKGRSLEERSVILIENGVYKGYGFYNLNFQINTSRSIKDLLLTQWKIIATPNTSFKATYVSIKFKKS